MKPQPIAAGKAAPGDFDPEEMEIPTGQEAWWEFVASYPQSLMCVARAATPMLGPLGGWCFVLRYDEVREVLSNSEAFPVPWAGKMEKLTAGKNFVLGMPYDDVYRLRYRQLAEAFRREDVAGQVSAPSLRMAREILEEKEGLEPREFDAVQDLIATVPARLCESYYGIEIPEIPGVSGKVLFAKWSLATSSYIFGPDRDARREQLGKSAARLLTQAIHASIASARARRPEQPAADSSASAGEAPPEKTVLDRLLAMEEGGRPLSAEAIHAHLFGMVLGFIPTNVLAGGNILETLLRRPDFLESARAAARADDDELLWRCLRETLRFRHINPGVWRKCARDFTLASGRTIPKGSNVLAVTQSAMFDSRRVERPRVFDPHRRDEDYMVFGVGQHWCIGAFIAKAQLTQTFKPLLKLRRLEAVRNSRVRTKRFQNLYPLHLTVGFDP